MERHTKSYLQLIKPGITLSNSLTALAGFFLAASTTPFSLAALIGGVGGTALVIASACVINNILDRDLDKRMKRTAKREVATGTIPLYNALVFGVVLGLVGFSALLALTNVLTFVLGVIAFIWYVVIYGIAKRTTALSTLIGGVPGALPPVAGYVALTGSIDAAAITLFLILCFWQIPHFYAISMFRRDDYAKAGLPVWAVRFGLKKTKLHILIAAILFALVVPLLTVFGYTGILYASASVALSLYWVYVGVVEYNKIDDIKWARKMFGTSLLVLLAMCLFIAIGGYLP
jgi:protoheme IX farnesyltransferase